MKIQLVSLLQFAIFVQSTKVSKFPREQTPCVLGGGNGKNYRRDIPTKPPWVDKPHQTYPAGILPQDLNQAQIKHTRQEVVDESEEQDQTVEKTSRIQRKDITFRRTIPFLMSFTNDCDYVAYYCMKSYRTGKVCGETFYYYYHTFPSYCLLDYVNCMERWDVWIIAYLGECATDIKEELMDYKHYPYDDDYFLDQYYVMEYGNPGK